VRGSPEKIPCVTALSYISTEVIATAYLNMVKAIRNRVAFFMIVEKS
jgi:hypothetical protein